MSSDPFIPLSVPYIAGNEWVYVKECLDTGWVSSVGSFVDRFEREFASLVGSKAAVACSSGTAALHMALLVAGVEPGDEVVVSTLTFIAPANAVIYLGAHPVFMDAEPRHWQMDINKLAAFLAEGCTHHGGTLRNRVTGRRVRAILPVHVIGHPCDLDAIGELATRYGLEVVEDATEALGSSYKGRSAGTMSRVGCFSFNGNKIITTGSGGMLVTDDLTAAQRAKYLTTQAKDEPIEFVHQAIGFNYRLSNVSAAIGVAQLERLNEFVATKRRVAQRYDDAFRDIPGIALQEQAKWTNSNRWLYTIRIDKAQFGLGSRDVMARLGRAGIQARPLWQPMHRSPAHAGAFAFECTEADRLNAECLSLPCSVGLSESDQERVILELRSCAGNT
jgi:perosamine synthetase